MELLIAVAVLALIFYVLKNSGIGFLASKRVKSGAEKSPYLYSRKTNIMTAYEEEFFKRLERLAGDRYYIFPQVHLSSLLENKTRGKHYKAAYQRLRRYAVDYALVDKQSLVTKYAVELDDRTHDARNRRLRDLGLERDLESAGVILIRFRNIRALSDDDIIQKFVSSNSPSNESDYNLKTQL